MNAVPPARIREQGNTICAHRLDARDFLVGHGGGSRIWSCAVCLDERRACGACCVKPVGVFEDRHAKESASSVCRLGWSTCWEHSPPFAFSNLAPLALAGLVCVSVLCRILPGRERNSSWSGLFHC